MNRKGVPDLTELMHSVPPATFTKCQIVVAQTVIAPSQTNESVQGEVLAYLPAGMPGEFAHRIGLECDPDGWLKVDYPTTDPIPIPYARAELATVLGIYRALRDWCRDRADDQTVLAALDSLSRLANALVEVDPDCVLDLFDDLEPVLKFGGDFVMLMRYGRIVERACTKTTRRDRKVVEYRTQATTCAIAWVLQRVGQLDEAEHQLEVDEQLNRDADEQRGLAFTVSVAGGFGGSWPSVQTTPQTRTLESGSSTNLRETSRLRDGSSKDLATVIERDRSAMLTRS